MACTTRTNFERCAFVLPESIQLVLVVPGPVRVSHAVCAPPSSRALSDDSESGCLYYIVFKVSSLLVVVANVKSWDVECLMLVVPPMILALH